MLPAFLRRLEGERVPPLFETVRLVYFDESGSSNDHIQEPVVTVAAVVVHGDLQTLPIEKDAHQVIETLVPENLKRGFEFHAKELFSGSTRTKGWPKSGRHAALTAFMGLIAKHNLPVLNVSVHKAGLWKNTPNPEAFEPDHKRHYPQQVAFSMCAEQVDRWFRAYAPFERGFCIADETSARDALRGSFTVYRMGYEALGRTFRTDHLIDMIYFGDSRQSIFLQLADSCAFFIKRMAMNRADAQPFYEVIASQVNPAPPIAMFEPLGDPWRLRANPKTESE